jgi:hypothetical protein
MDRSPPHGLLRTVTATPLGGGAAPLPGGDTLRALIAGKQRELEEMHELQIAELRGDLTATQGQLEAAAQQHAALLADFTFNLGLISERDEELAEFERAFAELRAVCHAREGAISELQARLAAAEEQRAGEQRAAQDKVGAAERRLREQRAAAEGARWAFEEDLRGLRDQVSGGTAGPAVPGLGAPPPAGAALACPEHLTAAPWGPQVEAARDEAARAVAGQEELVGRERAEVAATYEAKVLDAD